MTAGRMIPMVMRMGGGLVFVVKEDCVVVLRITPGQRAEDVLEVIGTANREHVAFVAAGLIEALGGRE